MSQRAGARIAPAVLSALTAPRAVRAVTIPPSLAVGRQVHYYPRAGEPNGGNTAGLLATITKVIDYDLVEVNNGGVIVRAARGGADGVRFGHPGTFDRLDTRHRSRLRLHLSYAEAGADNLLADPSLVTRYGWDEYDYDLVINSPTLQQVVFDRTVDKFRQLALMFPGCFNVGMGVLPIAAAHPDPGDPSNGIISIWCNPAFWEPWAATLEQYLTIGGSRLDGWIHLQNEEAFSEQALAVNVLAAGKTRADIKAGMASYTGVIRAHAAPVIVRPISDEDWGLLELLEAGAPGSIYCAENDGFSGLHYRRSKAGVEQTLGSNLVVWGRVRAVAPPHTFPNIFLYESPVRMPGRRIRRDWQKFGDRRPIIELTNLNEQNGAINLPKLFTTEWWRHQSLRNPPATGLTRASANDVFQCWTICGAQSDGQTVDADDAPGVAHDGVAGLSGPSSMRPWRRQVSPFIDAVNNSIPFDPLGRGWMTAKDADGVLNRADCWRLDVGSSGGSFFLRLPPVFLPSVAPAPGVFYGICGAATTNANVWALDWNGTTGNLELTVRGSVTKQTFTFKTAPTPGSSIIIAVGYDLAASATGKWYAGESGWVTPAIAMNVGNPAILIGGTHDLDNRSTVVRGCPGMVLPHEGQMLYWLRALTDAEIACVTEVGKQWPFGGTFGGL